MKAKIIIFILVTSLMVFSFVSFGFANSENENIAVKKEAPMIEALAALSNNVSDKLIRVGLLFHDNRHQEAVPFVTLTAENGMTVINNKYNAQLWSIAQGEQAVFQADQYYLVVQKTANAEQAVTVRNHLQGLGHKALIVEESLSKIKQYQVHIGHNSSYSQVNTLYEKIMAETSYSPTIEGYHRVQAGAYYSFDSSFEHAQALRDVGFPAYVAIAVDDSNNYLYRVVVGNAATEPQQAQIMNSLEAAFTGKDFTNANNESSILLKRSVIDSISVNTILFSDKGDKIFVKANSEADFSAIKIAERFNRFYRGTLELTTHNSRLAVINIIPMDQYLYGVVPREMASGWPMEALKAQAVIARTFALGRNGWGIADVVDDVKDQAYWGYGMEAADTSAAVDETRGQVLVTASGGLAQTFYSSNSGGTTAEGKEVWGTSIDYLRSVASPYDAAILDRISSWYRVILKDGTHGYVHANYLELGTDTVADGLFHVGLITDDNVNLRSNADIYHTSIKKLSKATQVVVLEKVYENNAYSWSKGPYTAIDIRNMINANQRSTNPVLQGAINSLVVTQTGESGRVMQVKANGQVVEVSSPDAHRSLFREGSSLRSTLFQIEARAEYTVLGANGAKVTFPNGDAANNLRAIDASAITGNATAQKINGDAAHFVLINKDNDMRVASKIIEFVFKGQGFGHGFGLSQWGAFGMARAVDDSNLPLYTYQDILHHYYSHDVSLIEMSLQ